MHGQFQLTKQQYGKSEKLKHLFLWAEDRNLWGLHYKVMPILKLNLLPKLFEIAMDYQKYPSTKLKVSMLLLMSTFLKQNMFSDFYFLLFSLPMNFWLNHTSFLWCLCISLTSIRVQISRTDFTPASTLLMIYALLKIIFHLSGQGMVFLVE